MMAQQSLGANLDRSETWLAGVWQRQAFRSSELAATNGLGLAVVYPGRPTSEAGPDFRGAIVALPDGTLLRGDVELHLVESDWWTHGHFRDAAYNQVVLHVVLERGRPALKMNGEPVLTLALERYIGDRRGGQPGIALGPAPCRLKLPRLSQTELREELASAARERFRVKAAVFEGELAVKEPEQVLYAGLSQALGYQRNQAPFQELAARLPLEVLVGRLAGWATADAAARLEELLLSVAGFAGEPPAEVGSLPASAWRLHGVRPQNLPAARIRAFARILPALIQEGLIESLLGPLEALAPIEFSAAGARLAQRQWREMLGPLGQQRADEVVVNVVLPFAFAWGETTCRFLLGETALAVYQCLPSPGQNQVTRYMRTAILGKRSPEVRGAAADQALLHVWDSWCHDKACSLCPLGSRRSKLAGT